MKTFTVDDLKLLDASIRKWQGIVYRGKIDHGSDDCPLCGQFLKLNCVGCTIREYTGVYGCHGTPYFEWCETSFPFYFVPRHQDWCEVYFPNYSVQTFHIRTAANYMLVFLYEVRKWLVRKITIDNHNKNCYGSKRHR